MKCARDAPDYSYIDNPFLDQLFEEIGEWRQ